MFSKYSRASISSFSHFFYGVTDMSCFFSFFVVKQLEFMTAFCSEAHTMGEPWRGLFLKHTTLFAVALNTKKSFTSCTASGRHSCARLPSQAQFSEVRLIRKKANHNQDCQGKKNNFLNVMIEKKTILI